MRIISLFIIMILYGGPSFGQRFPSVEENIPYLVTFGPKSDPNWGDDDNAQIFFFVIPPHVTDPFFIRVFDPEVGGKYDELQGVYDTKTAFTVIGGERAFSNDDKENKDPVGGYKNGNTLEHRIFGQKTSDDDKWVSFGPFNPLDGCNKPLMGGNIFKVIVEGISGDDGNLYRFFLSTNADENKPVEGGNAFTFEYTFRLSEEERSVAHVYPFVDENTISLTQYNFDVDGATYIRLVSVAKNGIKVNSSLNGSWVSDVHVTTDAEKGTSYDFQFVNTKFSKNNNVSFYVTNQYGKFMPFYSVPIGGVPTYSYSIQFKRGK